MAATVGFAYPLAVSWQFLTYGFTHASRPEHIILNMLTLWMFGRDIEAKYGPKEFLRLYLFLVVGSGLIWAVINRFSGTPDKVSVVGASGAVVGVVMLYALNFPHRTVLLFFIIPAPAWVMGVLLIFANSGGIGGTASAVGRRSCRSPIACISPGRRWPISISASTGTSGGWCPADGRWIGSSPARRSGSTTRLDQDEPQDPTPTSAQEVDRILEKIHREGEARLTRKERRTLVNASRQYQASTGRPATIASVLLTLRVKGTYSSRSA